MKPTMQHTPYSIFGGIGDEIIALGVTIGGLVHMLPEIVTLLGAVWYIINIWEWWKNTRKSKHPVYIKEEGPHDLGC